MVYIITCCAVQRHEHNDQRNIWCYNVKWYVGKDEQGVVHSSCCECFIKSCAVRIVFFIIIMLYKTLIPDTRVLVPPKQHITYREREREREREIHIMGISIICIPDCIPHSKSKSKRQKRRPISLSSPRWARGRKVRRGFSRVVCASDSVLSWEPEGRRVRSGLLFLAGAPRDQRTKLGSC